MTKMIKINTDGDFRKTMEILDMFVKNSSVCTKVDMGNLVYIVLKSLTCVGGRLTTMNPGHELLNVQIEYTPRNEKVCIDNQWEYEIIERE